MYGLQINLSTQPSKIKYRLWRVESNTRHQLLKSVKRLPVSNYRILRGKTHLRCLVSANISQRPWFLAISPDLHSSSSRLTYSNFTSDTINRSNFWLFISMKPPVDGWDISSSNRITDPQTIERSEWPAQSCPVDLLLALAYNGK